MAVRGYGFPINFDYMSSSFFLIAFYGVSFNVRNMVTRLNNEFKLNIKIKVAIMRLKEDYLAMNIVDILETLIQGRWEYLGGMVLGILTITLLRVVYMLWTERQRVKDTEYIQTHQAIPVEKLQSNAYKILASIFVLFLVVFPGTLWITVEILKSIESIDPGIALLFVFIVFILIMILLIVQVVRYTRLTRRIKLTRSQH